MTILDDEDVLQVCLSQQERIYDDVQDQQKIEMIAERALIKFITKGLTKASELYLDAANFLIVNAKTEIYGFHVKDIHTFLFEVALNQDFESWLVSLFEERQGGRPLLEKSRKNILKIIDGKFHAIVNGKLLNFVVLPLVKPVEIPCNSSISTYGLANGDCINIFAGSFKTNVNGLLLDIMHRSFAGDSLFKDKICGFRVEHFDDKTSLRIRVVMKISNVSDEFLKFLRINFNSVYFSSTTIHYPTTKMLENNNITADSQTDLAHNREIVLKNDILLMNENEMKAISNERLKMKNINQPVVNVKIKSLHLHFPSSAETNESGTSRTSVFDRLGPKLGDRGHDTLTVTRFFNKDKKRVRFDLSHDHPKTKDPNNSGKASSKKPKLQSVVIVPDKKSNN